MQNSEMPTVLHGSCQTDLALCPDTAPALSGLGTSVLKNESSAEVPVGREQLALFGVWSCGEPWCCPSYIPTIL